MLTIEAEIATQSGEMEDRDAYSNEPLADEEYRKKVSETYEARKGRGTEC